MKCFICRLNFTGTIADKFFVVLQDYKKEQVDLCTHCQRTIVISGLMMFVELTRGGK